MAEPVASEPTTLDQALAYARRGWRVIPIPPGQKYPRGFTAWQVDGTTDEAKIRHWWTNAPDHGIGIVTGATSGLWVLDVDVAGDKVGDETLADLCDAYGPLPDTHEVITGSGGRHLYFAWPTNGQIVTNSASGRLGPGLDVRGEGGFVVAPPSLHANGQRYEIEASSPDHVAPAPGWLLALLEQPEPAASERRTSTPAGDRPGDLWAATVTWADLLVADGWTLHHTDREGEEHWTRPGKDRRDGTSATTGYKGSDILKVFTSSHPQLRADETYTKFGYYAATRHDGNYRAARESLAADGHRAPSYDDLIGPSLKSGPAATARNNAKPPPPEPWPTPTGLPAPDPLPDVPVDVYPAWIAGQIRNVATQLKCDPVLPAMFALGALSVASLGHINIAVRAGETMRSTGLYIAVAGPPASGKSPALDMMLAPIRAHEQQAMLYAADELNRAVARRKMAEKEAQQAIDAAANTGDPDRKKLAEEMAVAAHLITDPPAGELMTSDITPERLASLMAANAERMAIVSDESGVLEVDRYGDRGKATKLDIYLQSFTGQPVAVHRVKAPTVRLTHPLLSIVAGVQPEALAAAMADHEWRTRGMGARFLTVTTDQLAANTDIDLDLWDHAAADLYAAQLGALATQWATWATPALLTIDPAARTAFSTWAADLHQRELPGGDLETEAGWTSKMRTSILRIAALFHLADGHPHSQQIDAATVERAITLGEFFIAHHTHEANTAAGPALRLLASIHRIATAEQAGVAHSGARHPLFVARRDLGRRGPRGMRKLEEFAAPLTALIEAGYVRPAGCVGWPNMQVSEAIRVAPAFEVHPDGPNLAGCATPRDSARHTPAGNTGNQQDSKTSTTVARVAYRGSEDPLSYPQDGLEILPPATRATGATHVEPDAIPPTDPDDDDESLFGPDDPDTEHA